MKTAKQLIEEKIGNKQINETSEQDAHKVHGMLTSLGDSLWDIKTGLENISWYVKKYNLKDAKQQIRMGEKANMQLVKIHTWLEGFVPYHIRGV